jgi:DNA-binding CsgD family transcriptional regulator
MKQSNAVAYLRQLCCLGLDRKLVILEFLKAVQSLIPSENNLFSGSDNQFNPTYLINEHITPELIDNMEIFPGFFSVDRRSRVINWFKQHPVSTDARLLDEKFYETDFYHLLWRILDIYHQLETPVYHQGQVVGLLCLNRPRSQKPFSINDQRLCVRLTPYLAHALYTQHEDDTLYCAADASGMMVMECQGRILFQCGTAKRLLLMASHPMAFGETPVPETDLMSQLAQLCRNLVIIFEGKAAAPPSWCYTNWRGRFLFRAYWLNNQNPEPGRLIGMTVEHWEPLVLKIMRIMQNFPLSPIQKEVALLLALGVASEKIGERLHIKSTTVKTHVSNILTKLDIHRREELLPKLLALNSSMGNVMVN